MPRRRSAPRAGRRDIPRATSISRSAAGFSLYLEDAITDVCSASRHSTADHAARAKFRELSHELKNRFIAHVVAELRGSRSTARYKEDPRKRPRSQDAYALHEDRDVSSRKQLKRPSRGIALQSLPHASVNTRRRASIDLTSNGVLDASDEEVESYRTRYRTRRTVDALFDEDMNDEVVIVDRRTQGLRRRDARLSSAETNDAEEKHSSEMHESDEDYEDDESHLFIPLVRPKKIVRQRSLCSDHMSLTPVIDDDDEGTDSEERRKAQARRPLRKVLETQDEPRLVFAVMPKEGHRLCFDHKILLPGSDGAVFLPVPKPEGVVKPSERSDILMHPLPPEDPFSSLPGVPVTNDSKAMPGTQPHALNGTAGQRAASDTPAPVITKPARNPRPEFSQVDLIAAESMQAPLERVAAPSSATKAKKIRGDIRDELQALSSIAPAERSYEPITSPLPVNVSEVVRQGDIRGSSTHQSHDMANLPAERSGMPDFNQFRSLMLAMGKSGLVPSMFYAQMYPQLMAPQGVPTASHVVQPSQAVMAAPPHVLPAPPHVRPGSSHMLPPHFFGSSTLGTAAPSRVVGVPLIADVQEPVNETTLRQIPAEHVEDFKDTYKRTLLELKKQDTGSSHVERSDLG